MNRREIIENALHDLFKSLQDQIGQDDGGVASVFMSDPQNCQVIEQFINEYLDLEELYRRL